MTDDKGTIDALADLMQEFGLLEAKLQSGDITVAFRHGSRRRESGDAEQVEYEVPEAVVQVPVVEAPKGTPITSPMTGIYYISASPNSPPFVREGDVVSAGQVIGLIEAMKVFNEILATTSGTVLKIVAETGQVVQPGDTLVLIG